MKLTSVLVLALAAESTVASSWFGTKAVYNKWHETELERWLSDHNIPYPTPADRKDLQNLVKTNWNQKVGQPYNDWSAPQLQSYLKTKGSQAQSTAGANKDALVNQVKGIWTESADSASNAYGSVKDWVFDSWTESQLKAFLDKNGIPAPQPRKRDTLLSAARANYASAAKKLNEYSAYPGSWLYESWSDSDLKAFLDERGISVPQPSNRDKLIASVRRNSRLASLNYQKSSAAASSSASAAQESLSDAVFDAWSDSKIKEWADKNGIKVPQGSKRNELIALARKHRESLVSKASSAGNEFGAATSKASNEAAKASDDAKLKAESTFDSAIATWSESRLKAYLDSRGVPVPQPGKKDELIKQVRLHKHKASTGYNAWTFDTWTVDNLKAYLAKQNHKAAKKSGATRDELVRAAKDNYAAASKTGGSSYASVTSYLASSTAAAKDLTFDTWSDSELKAYLDSYGVKNYQGSTSNELKAAARSNAQYFKYGTNVPGGSVYQSVVNGAQWVLDQLKIGAASGGAEGQKAANSASSAAAKASSSAKKEL